ncbi:MAG: ABC transporter ATP-binding protein [Planctomycetales bacterium]|nr:ABC transporter ATP-binding protein [Planctomycetales bacterium]
MDFAIELDRIVKRYRTHLALDGVSFQMGRGVTGLLGPNGAGKSTLIKILLGLMRATSGSGRILGRDIAKQWRAIRSLVGYMPEDDCYIPGMSGVEMVRYSASLCGMPALEGLRRAHEILDFCGMGQERYRHVETYSTGMRQKLKFAQAIVHDPELLILDEPTSGLDPEERVAMLNRVRTLVVKQGKRALVSTHILPDVRQVCDDVVILARGRVTLCSSMEEVDRPDQAGLFIKTLEPIRAFADALARKYPVELQGETELFVAADHEGLEQELWLLSSETQVLIESIYPRTNSLEAVFINAVKETRDANS